MTGARYLHIKSHRTRHKCLGKANAQTQCTSQKGICQPHIHLEVGVTEKQRVYNIDDNHAVDEIRRILV